MRIMPLSKLFRLGLNFAVAGVFAYLAFHGIEWAEIGPALQSMQLVPIGVGCLALAVGFYVRSVRWSSMLRPVNPSLTGLRCLGPFLASFAVNNTIPFRAGDVLRTVGFRDVLQVPRASVFGSLVLERLMDLLVLVSLLLVGWMAIGFDGLPRGLGVFAAAVGAATITGLFVLLVFPRVLQSAVQRVLHWPMIAQLRWHDRLEKWSDDFWALLRLVRSPALTCKLLGWSVLAWGIEGIAFFAVAASLNLEVAWTGPWLALTAGTLATMLPSTPGHAGTFDYFVVLGIGTAGIAASQAAIYALVVHMLLWLPVTAVGLSYLLFQKRFAAPQEKLAAIEE